MSQTVSEYKKELERVTSQEVTSDEDYARIVRAAQMEEALYDLQKEALQLGYSGNLSDAQVVDLIWFVEERKTTAIDKAPVKQVLTDIERACIAWASRDGLVSENQSEFLSRWHDEGGDWYTKNQFRRALEKAGERGLIEKGPNGRWREKTRH